MRKKYGREIANKPILLENFINDSYFEMKVLAKKNEFEVKYPDCEIVVKRNKHGARIIAYQKQTP